jgi:hypothetical protein
LNWRWDLAASELIGDGRSKLQKLACPFRRGHRSQSGKSLALTLCRHIWALKMKSRLHLVSLITCMPYCSISNPTDLFPLIEIPHASQRTTQY